MSDANCRPVASCDAIDRPIAVHPRHPRERSRQARTAEAEAEYRAALRLDASFAAAAINLSDLYRQLGRDGDGEQSLREALSASAENASLHHALGLTLVRLKRNDAALDELRQAASLDPGQARYA